MLQPLYRHDLGIVILCALFGFLSCMPASGLALPATEAQVDAESVIEETAAVTPIMEESAHESPAIDMQVPHEESDAAAAIINASAAGGQTSSEEQATSGSEAIATWKQPTVDAPSSPQASQKGASLTEVDLELDAYYTAMDIFFPLTNAPIPEMIGRTEGEIYGGLLLKSHRPRYIALEASVYPMPALGVFVRKNMEDLYEDAELGADLNIVKVVTAGFEEPYALSIFIGNVVKYKKPGQAEATVGNMGWVGYLLSHGDYHIKDNLLIYDKWYEFEWKIKGDREFVDTKHSWSFRVGLKFHDNPEITDVYYVSVRRSRLEFNSSAFSIKQNSAFEYTYAMSRHGLHAVQHKFFVEKKFPFKKYKAAFTLALGFIWDSGRKYTGELAPEGIKESYQYIIRPNIEF